MASRRAVYQLHFKHYWERSNSHWALVATNTFKPSSVLSHTHCRAGGGDRRSRRVGPRLLRCSGPWSRGGTGPGMWAHLSRPVTHHELLPATTTSRRIRFREINRIIIELNSRSDAVFAGTDPRQLGVWRQFQGNMLGLITLLRPQKVAGPILQFNGAFSA